MQYDICVLCRNKLDKVCLVCQNNNINTCQTITGRCGHIYHNCCIDLWLTNRIVCPLDNRIWKTKRKEIKTLSQMCQKKIATNINLTLEAIQYGTSIVTEHDWQHILKYANNPNRMYCFKRPEDIPLDAFKVLQIQFKTPTINTNKKN